MPPYPNLAQALTSTLSIPDFVAQQAQGRSPPPRAGLSGDSTRSRSWRSCRTSRTTAAWTMRTASSVGETHWMVALMDSMTSGVSVLKLTPTNQHACDTGSFSSRPSIRHHPTSSAVQGQVHVGRPETQRPWTKTFEPNQARDVRQDPCLDGCERILGARWIGVGSVGSSELVNLDW